MNLLLALLVGTLFGTGVYLMLRRNIVRLLIGLVLLGNGTNLLIFSAIGLVRDRPPITSEGDRLPQFPTADPVAQALILTAIVISFAVVAFALALGSRTYEVTGTEDLGELGSTDS